MVRDLKADLELCRSTSEGMWHVVNPDDAVFMNIVAVATVPDVDDVDPQAPFIQALDSNYKDCDKIVALFLLQTPRLATIADEKWWENARFLVEAHNGGWEEAIRRALEAEKRVRILEHILRSLGVTPNDQAILERHLAEMGAGEEG